MLPVSKVLFLALWLIVGQAHAQQGYGGENKIPLKKPDPPKPPAPMAPPPSMIIRPEAAPMAPPPAPMKKPFRVCSETQIPSDDNCVKLGPTASGTIRGYTDDVDE